MKLQKKLQKPSKLINITCKTLGPLRYEDFFRAEESGRDFAPMDRRSKLRSSDSADSGESSLRTVDFISSGSLKLHPLLIRASRIASDGFIPFSESLPSDSSAVLRYRSLNNSDEMETMAKLTLTPFKSLFSYSTQMLIII